MTLEELYNKVMSLPTEYSTQELEKYLRSLYSLVKSHAEQEPSLDLFYTLFEEAFTSEPVAFNESWLVLTEAPDANILSKKFTNPLFSDSFDKSIRSQSQGIDYVLHVLAFQIAELHKMKDKQLKNELRYFGVTSETGNYWYNFDPFTNLECGVRGLIDNTEDTIQVSWETLGEIIEMGRLYE